MHAHILYTHVHALSHTLLAACDSVCNEGAMRCSGFGSGCCTYYSEDLCVSECPVDTDVADENFNCVTRRYSSHLVKSCSYVDIFEPY